MRLRSLVGSGALLVAANIVGLVLNYAHQAQAAAVLSAASFGHFATWLGAIGIGLSLGLCAQLVSNYFVFSRRAFFLWRAACAAVAAGALLAHVFFGTGLSAAVLGVEAVAVGVALSVSTGQYQARLSFGAMAFAALTSFGTRALFPNLVSRPDENIFLLATPIAILVTLIALGPLSGRAEDAATVTRGEDSPGRVGSKIAASLVLAVCGSSFPVIDVLMVGRVAPGATAGHFAQAALFTRIPYFLGALFLQMTLPYHLRAARGVVPEDEIRALRKLERWVILAVCLSAPFNAAVVPWIAARTLGVDLSMAKTWILLSTLDFGALLALFRSVQIQCAKGAVPRSVVAVLALAAALLYGTYWASGGEVTRYLLAALGIYVVAALAVPFVSQDTASVLDRGQGS